MKAGSVQAESCCVYGINPLLFHCWSNPVAHLLLLKSSMARLNSEIFDFIKGQIKRRNMLSMARPQKIKFRFLINYLFAMMQRVVSK